jgi:hypothetical protein
MEVRRLKSQILPHLRLGLWDFTVLLPAYVELYVMISSYNHSLAANLIFALFL